MLDGAEMASDGEAHCGLHNHERLHRGSSHLAGWYMLEKVALGSRNWDRATSTLESPKMFAEHTSQTPALCGVRNSGKA